MMLPDTRPCRRSRLRCLRHPCAAPNPTRYASRRAPTRHVVASTFVLTIRARVAVLGGDSVVRRRRCCRVRGHEDGAVCAALAPLRARVREGTRRGAHVHDRGHKGVWLYRRVHQLAAIPSAPVSAPARPLPSAGRAYRLSARARLYVARASPRCNALPTRQLRRQRRRLTRHDLPPPARAPTRAGARGLQRR